MGPLNLEGGHVNAAEKFVSNRILKDAMDITAKDRTESPTVEAQLHMPLRHMCIPGQHGIKEGIARLSTAALVQRATISDCARLRAFYGLHQTALMAIWQNARAEVSRLKPNMAADAWAALKTT
jgi:hypothetical protein